jgi:hypothetical protein
VVGKDSVDKPGIANQEIGDPRISLVTMGFLGGLNILTGSCHLPKRPNSIGVWQHLEYDDGIRRLQNSISQKGSDSSAQGNALGQRQSNVPALQGRNSTLAKKNFALTGLENTTNSPQGVALGFRSIALQAMK